MDLDKLGRITGGIGLLLASMLAAPSALAQQVEEGPQVAPRDTILARISLLEARVDSLASELRSLKVAVAEAGIALLPGQDELEATPQDELEALRAAARRAVEEEGAPAEEPGEAAKSRTSSLQLLNPEISVTGDFVGAATAPGEGNGNVSAIPREFEFSFQAVIAFLFTNRPGPLLAIAWVSGGAAAVGGLWLSFVTDLPTGPVVVCSFAATLGLAFVVRRLWTHDEIHDG